MANFSGLGWYSYQPPSNSNRHIASVNTEIYNSSAVGNISIQHPGVEDIKAFYANSGVPGIGSIPNRAYANFLIPTTQIQYDTNGVSKPFQIYDVTTKQGGDATWYLQKPVDIDPGAGNGWIFVAYPSQDRGAAANGQITIRTQEVHPTDDPTDPNTSQKYDALYEIIYGSMSGANWPTWTGDANNPASADILDTVNGLFAIGAIVYYIGTPGDNPSYLVPMA